MEINSAQECYDIVKSFFDEKLSAYLLNNEWIHSPYWHIEYVKDNIKIVIDGDRGFYIYIYIYDTKYSLWQYDRSVNEKAFSIKNNLLYQLNVLKRFLCEIGYVENQ
ncbi:MAG: hypothetical protein LBU51_11105 [Bacteroidales bacterium]|jgi:hypothetical protein|nr:hypothetical protein [Bacteroidales bacterium]